MEVKDSDENPTGSNRGLGMLLNVRKLTMLLSGLVTKFDEFSGVVDDVIRVVVINITLDIFSDLC